MRADPACQKRLEELARRASGTGRPQLAGFLSPAEQAQAELCARRAGVALFLEGGTPDAERRVAAFADADWTPTWPIAALQIAWNARQGSPGHRDLLGSLLALGVDRSVLGDIFPGEGEARAYVLERVAAYLAENLTRVGGTAVSARVCEEALAPPAAAAARPGGARSLPCGWTRCWARHGTCPAARRRNWSPAAACRWIICRSCGRTVIFMKARCSPCGGWDARKSPKSAAKQKKIGSA